MRRKYLEKNKGNITSLISPESIISNEALKDIARKLPTREEELTAKNIRGAGDA